MERKYYLRGLGIGILVTAVIMGIALSGPRKMTDEEIIERARELGMVEDTYLSDLDAGEEQVQGEQNIEDADLAGQGEQNIEDTDSAAQGELSAAGPQEDGSQALPETDSEPVEEEPIPAVEPVETDRPETDAASEEAPSAEAPEVNTNEMTRQEDTPSSSVKMEKVTIVSGDGSYTVALKLKEAGVVMSAETFDTYLCEKGYDKRLVTGTFQIPSDASDEQIARIITGQE